MRGDGGNLGRTLAPWLAGDLGAALGASFLIPSLLGINALQAASLGARPFSSRVFRWINCELAEHWWAWLVAYFEKVQGVQVEITGDPLPAGENAILIANHQQMADVPVIMYLARRERRLRDLKWMLKDALKYVPGVGWGMLFLDSVFLKRSWDKDQANIMSTFGMLRENLVPFWLITFAEGTRITPGKRERSQAFARMHGYPELRHVLLPRPRGFAAALQGLGTQVDAVYDLTLAYPGQSPGLLNFFRGREPRVCLHVRRFARAELPASEAELGAWLRARFREKDERLERFAGSGRLN